jgi:hypothetical protein
MDTYIPSFVISFSISPLCSSYISTVSSFLTSSYISNGDNDDNDDYTGDCDDYEDYEDCDDDYDCNIQNEYVNTYIYIYIYIYVYI